MSVVVISLCHYIIYFFGIFTQIRYVVESWIEYLTKVKAVSTHESKESGHYICYKFVDGCLLCFDDALINRVDMMEQYKINLIVYCRYDIDPYVWNIDLGFITHVEQLGYSLRHPRHSGAYSLRDRVRAVPNKNQTDEQMEVTDTQILKSPDAASTFEVPLDMSGSNKVSVEQCDDASAQENIVNDINENEIHPNNEMITDSSLEQGTSADGNTKNTESHEGMNVGNV